MRPSTPSEAVLVTSPKVTLGASQTEGVVGAPGEFEGAGGDLRQAEHDYQAQPYRTGLLATSAGDRLRLPRPAPPHSILLLPKPFACAGDGVPGAHLPVEPALARQSPDEPSRTLGLPDLTAPVPGTPLMQEGEDV